MSKTKHRNKVVATASDSDEQEDGADGEDSSSEQAAVPVTEESDGDDGDEDMASEGAGEDSSDDDEDDGLAPSELVGLFSKTTQARFDAPKGQSVSTLPALESTVTHTRHTPPPTVVPVAPAPKPAPVPVTGAEKAAAKAQAATKDARKKRKRENDGAAAESPERLARTLFIGNVPVGTKAKVIKQLCCKAAGHDEASNTRCPVESVRFRSAPIAGMAVTPGSDYKDMRKVATHSLSFVP